MIHEADDDCWAPSLDERLDDLDWFIGKMRERMQGLAICRGASASWVDVLVAWW